MTRYPLSHACAFCGRKSPWIEVSTEFVVPQPGGVGVVPCVDLMVRCRCNKKQVLGMVPCFWVGAAMCFLQAASRKRAAQQAHERSERSAMEAEAASERLAIAYEAAGDVSE